MVAIARSMLNERNMPTQYWGKAVRYAVYVLNKLPTRSLSEITPHEAWFERKPSVEHLKIFGYLAYMKIPAPYTKKLDARSKEMVHLGREPVTKAYRLFDPDSGTVHISRDVFFDEKKGWDWTRNADTARNSSEQLTVAGYSDNLFDDPAQEVTEDSTTPAVPQNNTTATPSSPPTQPRDASELSEQPLCFRSLADVYADSAEIELEEELFLMGIDEPLCFEQEIIDEVWKDAMEKEMSSIEKNKTWELTTLPKGHKAIDLKWIFKVKRDQNGEVRKHKARLIAKGYVGVDYDEVFSPVTRLETVHLLLALAAKHD